MCPPSRRFGLPAAVFFLKVHNDIVDIVLLSRLHVRVHEDDVGDAIGVFQVVFIPDMITAATVLGQVGHCGMVQLVRDVGDQKRGGRLTHGGELRGLGMRRLAGRGRVSGVTWETQIVVLIHPVTDLPRVAADVPFLDACRAAKHVLGEVAVLRGVAGSELVTEHVRHQQVLEVVDVRVMPDRPGERELVVIVHDIQRSGQAHLLEIVFALRGDSLRLGLGQGGQQHRSQNGDDGDDHQQLNKGKPR